MFGLRFRDALPAVVVDEFDHLVSRLRGVLSVEHNDDGSHGDVTADSLTLQGAAVGDFEDLPYDAARYLANSSGTWTVGSADQVYLRVSRVGRLAWVEFWIQGSEVTVDTADDLIIRLPELHPLRAIVDAAVAFGSQHTGGAFQWADLSAPAAGMGYVVAVTVNEGGYQAAQLRLVKNDAAVFAITNNLMVRGSCWFPLNTNNDPIPF